MASGIQIQKALYGTDSTTVDVTSNVAAHLKDGSLNVVVSPDGLNVTDPAPGQQKTLTLSYTINFGKMNTSLAKDGDVLLINAPPEREADGLQITKAEYGYVGNFTDVTDAIQAHVKNGSINIKVSPATAGVPDPNPNKSKSLEVEYTLNGAPNLISVKDGDTFSVYAPAADGSSSDIKQNMYNLTGSLGSNIGWLFSSFFLTMGVCVGTRLIGLSQNVGLMISSAIVLSLFSSLGSGGFIVNFIVGGSVYGLIGTIYFFIGLFTDRPLVT